MAQRGSELIRSFRAFAASLVRCVSTGIMVRDGVTNFTRTWLSSERRGAVILAHKLIREQCNLFRLELLQSWKCMSPLSAHICPQWHPSTVWHVMEIHSVSTPPAGPSRQSPQREAVLGDCKKWVPLRGCPISSTILCLVITMTIVVSMLAAAGMDFRERLSRKKVIKWTASW